jgi:hypothetical protein
VGQVFKIMANTSIRQGLILLLIIPTMAWSFIGTITQQKHDPLSITRDKEKIVGIKGVGVEMNDALRTGQGTAEITFEDNTIVQMTESSRLTIDDFVYEPKNKDMLQVKLLKTNHKQLKLKHQLPQLQFVVQILQQQ